MDSTAPKQQRSIGSTVSPLLSVRRSAHTAAISGNSPLVVGTVVLVASCSASCFLSRSLRSLLTRPFYVDFSSTPHNHFSSPHPQCRLYSSSLPVTMQRYLLSGKLPCRVGVSSWPQRQLFGSTRCVVSAVSCTQHSLFNRSYIPPPSSYSSGGLYRLSSLTAPTRLSSLSLPLSQSPYVSSASHLFLSSSFATASSLGTPDPPEESKAGAPRTPSSPHTGSLGASDGSVVAGERQMPTHDEKQEQKQPLVDDHVKQLLSKDGTVRLTKDEIAKLEAALADKADNKQQQQYVADQQAAPAVHQTGQPMPLRSAPPASLGAPPFPAPHDANSSTTSATPPAPTAAASDSSSSSSAPASLSSSAHKNLEAPFLLPPVPPSSPLIRGVLWFDCVYPMQAHWLDPRHLLATHNHETLIPTIMPDDVEIISMIPRIKEGGVFVQFETKKGDQYETAHDVSLAVIRRLRKKPVRARFTTRPVHCHLVKGEPFLEDLMSRFPSARLKIEMKGSDVACKEVTLEHLFGELRSFGRIIDLILGPYVKDQPRQASIQYRRMHGAVGARQCLHRSLIVVQPPPPTVGATPPPATSIMLFFTYDSVLKTSYIIDFANKHPRIVVPLMGLILAAFTILIFDPLRSFNITNKITGRFTIRGLTHSGPLVFLRTQLASLWHHRIFDVFKHDASETVVRSSWSAREADEEKVNRWLHSIPDRLLFITGAKGAGKQALVRKVTADRKNVVTINFGQFIERNDEEFVKGLSNAIGFAPGFSILSWISNIMDIFTPGAGKASGAGTAQFTSQLQKILEVWTDALVAIDSRATKKIKSTADGQVSVTEDKRSRSGEVRDEMVELVKSGEGTSHPNGKNAETGRVAEKNRPLPIEKGGGETEERKDQAEGDKQDDTVSSKNADNGIINTDKIAEKAGEAASHHQPLDRSLFSDTIPLFVIDGFSPDNKEMHSNFMSSFVQFAAQMTAAQLARFLFLTDSTLEESISKSMPDVKVQEVTLSDADVDSALEFVMNSVSGSMRDKMTDDTRRETKRAVRILGGRYSDLLSLVRQLESGTSPMDAAEEIVNQSIGIVKSILFTDSKTSWNKTQLWLTMGMLTDTYDKSLQREQRAEQAEQAASVEQNGAKHSYRARDWIGYDDCLFNVFGGDDAALRGLVRADLLRIEGRLNEQDRLRAGSPVLLEAMRRMRQEQKFKAGMDVLVAKAIIDKEQKRLSEMEDELVRVGRLENEYVEQARRAEQVYGAHKRSKGWFGLGGESDEEVQRRLFREEMAGRRAYLLACLTESHEKITTADAQKRQCEATIKRIEM